MRHPVARAAPILAALALAAAPVAAKAPPLTPEQKFAQLTRDAVPGRPATCINLPQASDSRTIDGLGLAYRIGRTTYLNRMGGDCPLTRSDTLITSIPGTQLCRGDIARVVQTGSQMPRGSCIYGDFETYERRR